MKFVITIFRVGSKPSILIQLLILSCFLSLTKAQDSGVIANYVVVEVYIKDDDATARIEVLREEGIQASYIRFGYPDRRELSYVYVFSSSDLSSSLSESRQYRSKSGFEDTWVFRLRESDGREIEIVELEASASAAQPQEAETVNPPESESESDLSGVGLESGLSEEGMEEEIHHEEEMDHEEEAEDLAVLAEGADPDDYQKLFFRSFYKRNGRKVEATIKIVDGQKSRLLTSKHSYELINFLRRKDPGYPVQIVCEAFGYKKEVHDISLTSPMNGDNSEHLVSSLGDTLVVDFPLFRHNMGDTLVMFNVFFYNDSNIMRPKSSYELHELLQMMLDNEEYHIAIHGHTNSNRRGRIVKLKQGEPNFFEVTDESVRTNGSAKELSRLRAEIVKQFLMAKGIESERMLVEGWGGKHMLYEHDSREATKNARVEVVVLKE